MKNMAPFENWHATDKFRVYMTQGGGEALVGEYNSREEAEKVMEDGIARKDGSYRYCRLWESDQFQSASVSHTGAHP